MAANDNSGRAWLNVAEEMATLSTAPSLPALWKRARRLVQCLGFDGICVVEFRGPFDIPKIVRSTFPADALLAKIPRKALREGAPPPDSDDIILLSALCSQGAEGAVLLTGRDLKTERRQMLEPLLRHAVQAAFDREHELRNLTPAPAPRLSKRELEVMRWVSLGKSNSVVAEILGISVGSVDTYMRRIFQKLGVNDRTSAALKISRRR